MFSFLPHIERKCEKRLVPQLFSFSESESDFDDDIHRDHLEPSPCSPSSVPEVPLPTVYFGAISRVREVPPANEPENKNAEAEPEGPEGVSMKTNLTLILQGSCSHRKRG